MIAFLLTPIGRKLAAAGVALLCIVFAIFMVYQKGQDNALEDITEQNDAATDAAIEAAGDFATCNALGGVFDFWTGNCSRLD